MPELTGFVVFFLIQSVLERSITLPQQLVEFRFILDTAKIERIARREDDNLLGEISVVGIVEAV